MKTPGKKFIGTVLIAICVAFLAGLLLPEHLVIPVLGATESDWNQNSFWYHPWGRSGVHKGIDIFAREGTPVMAASTGLVIYTGEFRYGGNVVLILGPKWRIHYYAHLKSIESLSGRLVTKGKQIGTVGTTGNAIGKPAHLHYAIVTPIPYVWRIGIEKYGFEKMFYLNPHERLAGTSRLARYCSP